jgi:hypothetical protein
MERFSDTDGKLLPGFSAIFGDHIIRYGVDEIPIRSRCLVCLRSHECARFTILWEFDLITAVTIDGEQHHQKQESAFCLHNKRSLKIGGSMNSPVHA